MMFQFYQFSLYFYKYENICLSLSLFIHLFSAFSKPIGIPFGTKLLFAPVKVLTKNCIVFDRRFH